MRTAVMRFLLLAAGAGRGIETVRERLAGRTTVVAGPSGAGKSTVANRLQSVISMETGEISRKLKRGRHTTRHSQLIPVEADTYLCDTPALLLSILWGWRRKNCGIFFRSSVLLREHVVFRAACTSMSRTARSRGRWLPEGSAGAVMATMFCFMTN